MVSRIRETYREGLRKEFGGARLYDNVRICDSPLMLRWVDEDVINKARLELFHNMNRTTRKFATSTEDIAQSEKYRDSWRAAGTKLDVRDFDLDTTVEEIYFNYFQHGFNGSPVVDRPGTPYKCHCGVTMDMDMRTAPLSCPICKRLTPVGELAEIGVMRR